MDAIHGAKQPTRSSPRPTSQHYQHNAGHRASTAQEPTASRDAIATCHAMQPAATTMTLQPKLGGQTFDPGPEPTPGCIAVPVTFDTHAPNMNSPGASPRIGSLCRPSVMMWLFRIDDNDNE